MGKFITGVLNKNEAGATYEGVVHDRFLTLQHSSGQLLSIFDMGEPISACRSTNHKCEMILVASVPVDVKVSPVPPSIAPEDWHGSVVELAWKATKGSYSCDRVELYQREWVLLATALGDLLMHRADLGVRFSVGDMIQWSAPRLDLYAVV